MYPVPEELALLEGCNYLTNFLGCSRNIGYVHKHNNNCENCC